MSPRPPAAPGPTAALAAELRLLDGVATLVPVRPEVRDVLAQAASALSARGLAIDALGRASGGTPAEPVLVRIVGEEVSVSVDVGVTADASAPDVARAVGAAVREWCRREHPLLHPRVAVRIAAVD